MPPFLPLDVILLSLGFLSPVVDYRTLCACSLVCRDWRLVAQALLFRHTVIKGEYSPVHFHRSIERFEDEKKFGRYVRKLEIVGKSKHVLGLVPLASFPTLAGSDVMRLVQQMPLLEELIVKGTIWVGDYVTGVSHSRLRTLRIEQVQCMGPRSNPLALTSYAHRWQELALDDIRWHDIRFLSPPANTYARSFMVTLPESVLDVAQFVDRMPVVENTRVLTMNRVLSYGSRIINRIADSSKDDLEEIHLAFALEEEGTWLLYAREYSSYLLLYSWSSRRLDFATSTLVRCIAFNVLVLFIGRCIGSRRCRSAGSPRATGACVHTHDGMSSYHIAIPSHRFACV